MIGMGCARKLIFSWAGNPGLGLLDRFRDAVEKGWPRPLVLEEHTHAVLAAAYAAGRGPLALWHIAGLSRYGSSQIHADDILDEMSVYRREYDGRSRRES